MLIETCLKVRNTLEMRSARDLAFAIWRRPNRALFQSPMLANSLGRRRLLLFEIWKALSRDLVEEYVMVAPPDSLHLLLGLKASMHQLLIDYLHLAKHTFTKLFLNVLHLKLLFLHPFFLSLIGLKLKQWERILRLPIPWLVFRWRIFAWEYFKHLNIPARGHMLVYTYLLFACCLHLKWF